VGKNEISFDLVGYDKNGSKSKVCNENISKFDSKN
jgi:hypothetical protein